MTSKVESFWPATESVTAPFAAPPPAVEPVAVRAPAPAPEEPTLLAAVPILPEPADESQAESLARSLAAARAEPEPQTELAPRDERLPRRPASMALKVVAAVAALASAGTVGFFLGVDHAQSTKVAVAPAPPSSRPEPRLVPDASAPAVVAVVVAAPADASSAEAIAEATPDAGAPAPIAIAPPVVEDPADAGASAAAPEPGSKAAVIKVANRGRVTMGQVQAPAAGTVTWTATQRQAVKRGEAVGSFKADGPAVPLVAPKAGLFMPAVADGASAEAGATLASIVYFEAFVQAVATGVHPLPSWSCEVFSEASGEKAPCKVVSATPRGAGFFVTATTEPMWFDTCAEPRLRLTPP